MTRCEHGFLAGLCVVDDCPHVEQRTKRPDCGAPKVRPLKRCDRCDLRKPSLVQDGRNWHCHSCIEELEAYRASRGTGGFSQRVRGPVVRRVGA